MIKFSSWYRIDTEDLSRKISLNVLRITIATFALSFVLFEKHLSPPFFLIPLRSFFFFFLLRLRFFVHVRRVCFVLVRCSSLPCLSVHPPFYSWAVNYFSLHPPSPPGLFRSIRSPVFIFIQLTNCRADTWTRKRFTSALMREIVVAGQQTCRRFVRRPAGRVQPHFLAGGSLGRASRKYSLETDNWRSVVRSNVSWQGENCARIGRG